MGKHEKPHLHVMRARMKCRACGQPAGTGLVPCNAFTDEKISEYGFDRHLEMTLYQRRSNPHNSLYWVILSICVANKENAYGSAEDLHKALKVALGYSHKIRLLVPSDNAKKAIQATVWLRELYSYGLNLESEPPPSYFDHLEKVANVLTDFQMDCQYIVLPGSTAFDAMDQAEFRIYFDRAMIELSKAGYPIREIMQEAEKQLETGRGKEKNVLPSGESCPQ